MIVTEEAFQEALRGATYGSGHIYPRVLLALLGVTVAPSLTPPEPILTMAERGRIGGTKSRRRGPSFDPALLAEVAHLGTGAQAEALGCSTNTIRRMRKILAEKEN